MHKYGFGECNGFGGSRRSSRVLDRREIDCSVSPANAMDKRQLIRSWPEVLPVELVELVEASVPPGSQSSDDIIRDTFSEGKID